jgi:hypothetical protein
MLSGAPKGALVQTAALASTGGYAQAQAHWIFFDTRLADPTYAVHVATSQMFTGVVTP